MKFDSKGNEKFVKNIDELIGLLRNANDLKTWEYMGLEVVLDPTVDFTNENILIRWTDINEGFNDKIIVHSTQEFNSMFKSINL